MEQFRDFYYILGLLERAFILKFSEYDDTGRCYFEAEDCIPIVKEIRERFETKKEIQLLDAITGDLLTTLFEERDFEKATLENYLQGSYPHLKLTLHFKSGYRYVVQFKKM